MIQLCNFYYSAVITHYKQNLMNIDTNIESFAAELVTQLLICLDAHRQLFK